MPFLDENGDPLRVIHLRQAPATGHYFQLTRPIGFRESADRPILWAPAHVPADDPLPGNRTDLASVPWPLWGFISPFGRQSAPAILHDRLRTETSQLDAADALGRAAEHDRIFRVGLRQQKVPLLRAWLMWAFVSVERYRLYARGRFLLMLGQAALSVAVIYAAIILSAGSPLWLSALALPLLSTLLWGRHWLLLVWLSYASAVLLPLMLLQLCALTPYWFLELLVREAVDRPFVDSDPGPIAVPFIRAR